jgi:hypothetical protein
MARGAFFHNGAYRNLKLVMNFAPVKRLSFDTPMADANSALLAPSG